MSEVKFEEDSLSPCVRLFIDLLLNRMGDSASTESRTCFHLDKWSETGVEKMDRAPQFRNKEQSYDEHNTT
jgi:hypothetical protein